MSPREDPLAVPGARDRAVLTRFYAAACRRAARALGSLIGPVPEVSTPTVLRVPLKHASRAAGDPRGVMTGIRADLTGTYAAHFLLLMDLATTRGLLERMLPGSTATPRRLTALQLSALRELANIVIGAALPSVRGAGRGARITVPEVAIDLSGALLADLAARACEGRDPLLILEASLHCRGLQAGRSIRLLTLPSPLTLRGVLDRRAGRGGEDATAVLP